MFFPVLNFRLTLFLLIFIPSFTFAQEETSKEKKYKWGCSFAINSVEAQFGKPEEVAWGYANAYGSTVMERTDKSVSLSILPKYLINNYFLLRFEFCITNFNVEINSTSKNTIPALTTYTVQSGKSDQKVYKYIGGVQYSFLKTKRLDSYCGLSISYTKYLTMIHSAQSQIRNVITDTITNNNTTTGTNPGGFSTGLGIFSGFNFYLQKHISIGGEFSSSLLYYKIGGIGVGESTSQIGSKLPVTSKYVNRSTSYKGLQFSKIISSLNIAVWF